MSFSFMVSINYASRQALDLVEFLAAVSKLVIFLAHFRLSCFGICLMRFSFLNTRKIIFALLYGIPTILEACRQESPFPTISEIKMRRSSSETARYWRLFKVTGALSNGSFGFGFGSRDLNRN